jgi:hypothetical protein
MLLSQNLENEWNEFILNQNNDEIDFRAKISPIEFIPKQNIQPPCGELPIIPKCEELFISTKTKVLFLNREIDIENIFWKIPIIEYWKPVEGIIKKQMKIVSKTPEDYDTIKEKLQNEYFYTENIIKQINNPTARRIKFKDERKITIGLSRKDIVNSRLKVKNAFYNCFAIVFRFIDKKEIGKNYVFNSERNKIPEIIVENGDTVFREIHVKIFNTGKLEIPGIVNPTILERVKILILDLFNSILSSAEPINFIENKKSENVLINSNFNCGYFIDRDILYSILKSEKYNIETAYDPCSYPGVKCKFYFNNELGFDIIQNGRILQEDRHMKMSELIENRKYTEVSFMIFRTGSCLIVGNCTEKILVYIYEFIRKIFQEEYNNISVKNEEPTIKNKSLKMKKKQISVQTDYFNNVVQNSQK